MSISEIYTLVIYQPFLNILVGIYWLLGQLPNGMADMGIAVIIFTVVIRVLMLPLTFSGERTAKERREIAEKVRKLEETYSAHPVVLQEEKRRILRGNHRVLISELVTLAIQVIIALMLWRIFAKGLAGEDLHFIYEWMPKVETPLNLTFLGKYDLTHPHWSLNLLQSVLIAILEALHMFSSPYKVTRKEMIRLQFTLPIVSFLVFMFLPAGKKLFVITALCFSILYKIFRIIQQFFQRILPAAGEQEISVGGEDKDTPQGLAKAPATT